MRALLFVYSAVVLVGCSSAPPLPEAASAGPAGAEPAPATKELLQRVQGYASWPKFAENAEPKLSQGHDRMWVVAYHNDVVAAAAAEKRLPLPDGSVIVKTNAPAPDGEVMALTVMSKQDGQWYWVKATPDGKVLPDQQGRPIEGTGGGADMCIACHRGREDNDLVFTHSFR